MRAALYRPTPIACNLLLEDLEPRCLPRGDQHCSIWSRGLPCIVDQTVTLHRGDFVQIRLMPEWSPDILRGNFLGSEDFYRYGLTVTHWSSTGEIPIHFLTVDGQQHDSALSSFNTLSIDAICRRAEAIWGPQAIATFVRDRSDITMDGTLSSLVYILMESLYLLTEGFEMPTAEPFSYQLSSGTRSKP